jgi:hypothetical protein
MRLYLRILVPAVLVALALGVLPPAEAAANRIVFLNLTLVDDEVHLNDVKVVEGHFKQRKAVRLAPNHLYYVMTSATGETLYEGTMPDPSILRVEYVDDEGHLQMKTAKRAITDFSIRLPYFPEARRVTIRKIGGTAPGIDRIAEATRSLGSFVIDLKGGAGDD